VSERYVCLPTTGPNSAYYDWMVYDWDEHRTVMLLESQALGEDFAHQLNTKGHIDAEIDC